jgi:hypothetical protein
MKDTHNIVMLLPMKINLKEWDQQAVMDYVCERIASSSNSIETILKLAPYEMPDRRTIFSWLSKKQCFDHQYAHAREAQADFMLDEINEIADNVGVPVLVDGLPLMIGGKQVMVVDSAAVGHARLKIDTRKWTMSKLAPKKYSDKILHKGDINLNLTLEQAIEQARQERLVN